MKGRLNIVALAGAVWTAVFGIELWQLQAASESARRATRRLEAAGREWERLRAVTPTPCAAVGAEVAAEEKRLRRAVESRRVELGFDAPDRTDAGTGSDELQRFFEVEEFAERLVAKAAECGVEVSAGCLSGVGDLRDESVRNTVGQIVAWALVARPRVLVGVDVEEMHGSAGAASRRGWLVKIRFEGSTHSLRRLLNSLAAIRAPIAVHAVSAKATVGGVDQKEQPGEESIEDVQVVVDHRAVEFSVVVEVHRVDAELEQ